MVVKKARKSSGKKVKKENEGVSLDDALGDDEGVEYAPNKPRREKKKNNGMSEEELEEELDAIEAEEGSASRGERTPFAISASKPISSLKKGDRIQIDGKEYVIDAHTVLIDHGNTREMALELYDSTDKDYQLRYFSDQVKSTLELYELQEILYVKKPMQKIIW